MDYVQGICMDHGAEAFNIPQNQFDPETFKHKDCKNIMWLKNQPSVKAVEPVIIDVPTVIVSEPVPTVSAPALTNGQANLLSDVREYRQALNSLGNYVLEREQAIDALGVTFLARQHAVIYGTGGTGKNMMIRAFAQMFDRKYWEYQIFQATTVDELMGGVDFKSLRDSGEMRRVTEDTLLDCHIGFLDEIGNSSSVIRNKLKDIMQEREVRNGRVRLSLPIESIIAASNAIIEYQKDATEAAFADRWLTRIRVQDLQEPENEKQMLRNRGKKNSLPIVGADVLTRLQNLVPLVEFSEDLIAQAVTMRHQILEDPTAGNLQISTRRFNQTMDLVAAHAILNGRMKAKRSDLTVFGYTFWNDYETEERPLKEWLKAHLITQLDKVESMRADVEQTYQAWQASISNDETPTSAAQIMQDGLLVRTQLTQFKRTLERLRPALEDEEEVEAANSLEKILGEYQKDVVMKAAEIATNAGDNDDDMGTALDNLKK